MISLARRFRDTKLEIEARDSKKDHIGIVENYSFYRNLLHGYCGKDLKKKLLKHCTFTEETQIFASKNF